MDQIAVESVALAPAPLLEEAARHIDRGSIAPNTADALRAVARGAVTPPTGMIPAALVQDAPHAPSCASEHDQGDDDQHPCDCWKRDALAWAPAAPEPYGAAASQLNAAAQGHLARIASNEFWYEQGLRVGAGQGLDFTDAFAIELQVRAEADEARREAASAAEAREFGQSAAAGAVKLTDARKRALQLVSNGTIGFDPGLPKYDDYSGSSRRVPTWPTFQWLRDNGLINIDYLQTKTLYASIQYHPVTITPRGTASLEA